MKSLLYSLLALSLLGNGVLLAWRFTREPSVPGDESGHLLARSVDHSVPGATGSIEGVVDAPDQGIKSTVWNGIAAPDLRTLVANLRAAGFSEADLQAVARAIIAERLIERRRAMFAATGPQPYWVMRRGDGLSTEQRAELRELRQAQDAELRAVFGSLSMTESERRTFRTIYGPLPDEKIRAIMDIQSDYGDIVSEVYREVSGGVMMPWDREKIAFIEAEQRKDIAAVLTLEEQELHRLYASGPATGLRFQLAGFEPTEAEFRAILKIREQFESRLGGAAFFDEAIIRQRQQSEIQAKAEIRAVLGEARFADYERVTDHTYRRAAEIVARFNLPRENATAAYALGREMQTRASALRAEESLSADDRTAAFAALAREASERLGAVLTREGATVFRNSAGGWLRDLEMNGGIR